MGAARARRLCPEAIVVAPRFPAYVQASRAVFEIFDRTTPIVERLSIDEAFLDVRGLEHISGTPSQIAQRLRQEVRDEVGLPISVGVATTKHLAKVASNAAKPDGLLVIPAGQEPAFLRPLPVQRLWGVGPATTRRLREQGIITVGQLAILPEPALMAIVGRAAGRKLHAMAHNRDPRRVQSRRGRRSFGAQSALGARRRSPEALDAVAVALVDRVTRRMRTADRAGRTVVLRLRFADFSRASRSRTLARPTAATSPILTTLRDLLGAERRTIERRGLTLLGVTVTNLERDDAGTQLVLPVDACHRDVDAAVDAVRDRYGNRALQRAALLDAGEGVP
jgi:DNA polymerase-4